MPLMQLDLLHALNETFLIKEMISIFSLWIFQLYVATFKQHVLMDYTSLSWIRVITKLPNSEQSNKGKVKTHKYINRQNQSTTENCENRNDPDLVQAYLKKWWVESDFKAPNLPLSLRLKVSGCHYNSIYNNTWTKQVKQLSNQRQTQWSKCQKLNSFNSWSRI